MRNPRSGKPKLRLGLPNLGFRARNNSSLNSRTLQFINSMIRLLSFYTFFLLFLCTSLLLAVYLRSYCVSLPYLFNSFNKEMRAYPTIMHKSTSQKVRLARKKCNKSEAKIIFKKKEETSKRVHQIALKSNYTLWAKLACALDHAIHLKCRAN